MLLATGDSADSRFQFITAQDIDMGLKGLKTEQSLKDAFAGESQANRRHLYFANKADLEGQNDVAARVRSTAERDTGHPHGYPECARAWPSRREPTVSKIVADGFETLAKAKRSHANRYQKALDALVD